MELQEIMRQRVFAVVGNTLDSEKYAYKIKQGMIEKGYTVYAVGKELPSLNDVPEEIDIIDLCIHPAKGLELMRECKKSFKCIVLQPGAESAELVVYLEEKGMPYINGCLLVGMRLFT
ncbi:MULTISPECIES: CoA-binding protein [unclassified Oscillibacter]|uniref:CoA-binding protein n=1 Tax=unclassified Oscillibacter TaxID=2629304 RepID=UPI0025DBD510|nr:MULTISPECIES: CoA-binding protein [unclassified Oscillibacter]